MISLYGEMIMGVAVFDRYLAKSRWVKRASAVIVLPSISMASSNGMAVLISLVRFCCSLPFAGMVPTFFGCGRSYSGDQ